MMNMSAHAGHDMSGHDMSGHDMSGHDMSGHDMSGHDMSSHDMSNDSSHNMTGHDMTVHNMSGHDMSSHDMGSGHGMHGAAAAGGHGSEHSAFVYMSGGHGDGVLQAGVTEVLLFKGAATSSAGSLILACFILMLLAILLEYVRLLAWWLESRYVKCSGGRRDDADAITTCNGGKKSSNSDNVSISHHNGDSLMSSEHTKYDALSDGSAPKTEAANDSGGASSNYSLSAAFTTRQVDATRRVPTCEGTSPSTGPDDLNILAAKQPRLYSILLWVSLGVTHLVSYVWATCLMLITMTFNIYLIVAIATGVAIGKLAVMYTRSKMAPRNA